MSDEIITDEKTTDELTGKKVFFLYPTASVKNQVITELVQHEIEVYTCKDHNKLGRVIKNYPDAIIFANIDESMPELEWERWISNVKIIAPNVKVGVFSSSSDEELKNKYLNKLNAACGFITLKLDMTKAIQKIIDILEVMNVKGRRKYLRASVERETTATINMPYNGEYINGTIKDISVVGISCVFDHDPGLKKNALHKDLQIRLQSMLLKVEAVVFGSRENDGQLAYVLIFTQRIDPEVRVKIRKYIQQNLQSKMDSEIN
ncbi:MAG: PilZ domain-containing protein [Treponema sp.]|nr:PilZ domain-containing protein [Treponema sp.]